MRGGRALYCRRQTVFAKKWFAFLRDLQPKHSKKARKLRWSGGRRKTGAFCGFAAAPIKDLRLCVWRESELPCQRISRIQEYLPAGSGGALSAAVSPPAFCSCRFARRQKRRSGFARKNARLCHTCRRGWFWGQYILLTKGGGGKGSGAKRASAWDGQSAGEARKCRIAFHPGKSQAIFGRLVHTACGRLRSCAFLWTQGCFPD